MGLLEKLWDDTLAGPQPDTGLGRLRKSSTFSPRSAPSSKGAEIEGGNVGESYGGDGVSGAGNPEEVRVSRRIMIVKPPGYNQSSGSAPASPAGYTPPSSPFSRLAGSTPTSPFSGSRSGAFRFRRRSTSDANEKAANEDRTCGSSPPV